MKGKWAHTDTDYPNYSKSQQEFMQRMLFLDYVDEWEVEHFHGRPYPGLLNAITEDMLEYEMAEQYETCQLYRDILERYKKDIEEFDD